ncbi:MAG: molybdopterin-dependent oxidoreductase [Acidimicrobiales bacterium]
MTRPARAAGLKSLTTHPHLPLRQGAYRSPLRDERLASILGASLGILFFTCFFTGLYSHLQQNPISWLPIPTRPSGLYRFTQGLHIATGIASLPVLVAKLWLVWPRLVSRPAFIGVRGLFERIGLLPLVAGGIWLTFSGVANIAQWYPWRFSFTASHYWVAWITIGAMVAHMAFQWRTTRRTLTRPSRRPSLADADPHLGASHEREPSDDSTPVGVPGERLSRRGFLWSVAAASVTLTVTTVGQTFAPLRRLALLAPRDPKFGPQGRPVNRSAAAAGVVELARDQDYRLVVEGRVARPLTLDLDDLRRRADATEVLSIACVEGWSYSAQWRGIRVADLLDEAGAEAGRTVVVESLEPQGGFRSSTLNPGQAAASNTLLATHLDGEVLDIDHGFPCRLVAPNRPGVLQTKWVTKLVVI